MYNVPLGMHTKPQRILTVPILLTFLSQILGTRKVKAALEVKHR